MPKKAFIFSILVFMSNWNVMLIWVEHKNVYTFGAYASNGELEDQPGCLGIHSVFSEHLLPAWSEKYAFTFLIAYCESQM